MRWRRRRSIPTRRRCSRRRRAWTRTGAWSAHRSRAIRRIPSIRRRGVAFARAARSRCRSAPMPFRRRWRWGLGTTSPAICTARRRPSPPPLSCHSPRGGSLIMRRIAPPMLQHSNVDRRRFLEITSFATATALLGVTTSPRLGYAAALTKEQRDKLTPDDIVALMKKGNERFRLGQESPHDYLAQQKATVGGQHPAAIILSCIDSRAPAETIMDLGIGDCFNARVAGNVANDDILGSMEFACKEIGRAS